MVKPVGIIVFPGTQCDRETAQAFLDTGAKIQWIGHQDSFDWSDFKALVLPGGFSYGDYLRAGALSARSPAIKSTALAVKKGVPVLGICNGFQILCEAGLLPGTLMQNSHLKFIDQWVKLNLENPSPFFGKDIANPVFPIAHKQGCYFAPPEVLEGLKQNQQIWFTYQDNPNGSSENIAGVLNKEKNVAGLMPHPERAMKDWMGSSDGFQFFSNLN